MGIGFARIGNWMEKLTSPSAANANDDADPAFREFNEAVRLRPKDATPYFQRASAYLKAKKAARAIQDLDQAIQINPAYFQAYLKRGIANAGWTNFPAAVGDCA